MNNGYFGNNLDLGRDGTHWNQCVLVLPHDAVLQGTATDKEGPHDLDLEQGNQETSLRPDKLRLTIRGL